MGEEPVEVTARIFSPANDARFKEVESTVSLTLQFPSGVIANCATSYSLHEKRHSSVLGSKAHAQITNAFAYEGQQLHISQRDVIMAAIYEAARTGQAVKLAPASHPDQYRGPQLPSG